MLRHIYVIAIYNPEFLLQQDTPDESLQMAALHAKQNKLSGRDDTYVFILCGDFTRERAVSLISPYGFPNAYYISICTQGKDGYELNDSELQEKIFDAISAWLQASHSTAITCPPSNEYGYLDMLWEGVEAPDTDWDFLYDYSHTLPHRHKFIAGTWLTILEEELELEVPCWSNIAQLKLYAAALSELLHTFAMRENRYYCFDPEHTFEALRIDDIYLGILLGQQASTESFDEIMYHLQTDELFGVRYYAFQQAIKNKCKTVLNALTRFFGSETSLFWALFTIETGNLVIEPTEDLLNRLKYSTSLASYSDAWEVFKKEEKSEAPLPTTDNSSSDFEQLGQDFFRCYFGSKPYVNITDVANILGLPKPRVWGQKFQCYMEAGRVPFIKKKGRMRVIPATLSAWFQIESYRRNTS